MSEAHEKAWERMEAHGQQAAEGGVDEQEAEGVEAGLRSACQKRMRRHGIGWKRMGSKLLKEEYKMSKRLKA